MLVSVVKFDTTIYSNDTYAYLANIKKADNKEFLETLLMKKYIDQIYRQARPYLFFLFVLSLLSAIFMVLHIQHLNDAEVEDRYI